MTREDEYTFTLSSGKIVALISGALCAMLVCFITGLVIGRGADRSLQSPASAAALPPTAAEKVEQLPKVSLPELPKPGGRPDVAAISPPPKKAEVATQQTPPPPAASVEPTPKPSASAPSAGIYTICVLSARYKEGAENFASELRKQGYKASVRRTELKSGSVWYRTVIGEFADRQSAQRQLEELKKKGKFRDAFVVALS